MDSIDKIMWFNKCSFCFTMLWQRNSSIITRIYNGVDIYGIYKCELP